jgi:hypothetical protein
MLVVPRELEIKSLPRHAGGDHADAGPRVQTRLERGDRRRLRPWLLERESECGGEKGSATIRENLSARRCVLVRPVSYTFGDSANGTSAGISATRCAHGDYPLTAPVRAVT